MKSIEERADAYVGHPEEIDEFTSATIKRDAYIRGAKEQKAIDDAECANQVLMGKGDAVNHYKQGFHDAIEKARKWFADYLMDIGYPDDWMRDSPNMESGEERFIKAMEE